VHGSWDTDVYTLCSTHFIDMLHTAWRTKDKNNDFFKVNIPRDPCVREMWRQSIIRRDVRASSDVTSEHQPTWRQSLSRRRRSPDGSQNQFEYGVVQTADCRLQSTAGQATAGRSHTPRHLWTTLSRRRIIVDVKYDRNWLMGFDSRETDSLLHCRAGPRSLYITVSLSVSWCVGCVVGRHLASWRRDPRRKHLSVTREILKSKRETGEGWREGVEGGRGVSGRQRVRELISRGSWFH